MIFIQFPFVDTICTSICGNGIEIPASSNDFLNRVAHVRDNKGLGFFWWEPAWIPVHGSGWATPASLKYMNDPGPCGNEWANQALFDYDGNVLPALEVIRDFRK